MTDNWTDDQIDKMLQKAYQKDQEVTPDGSASENKLPREPKSDETFEVLNYRRDPENIRKVQAYNAKVRASGVINHFVLDEKLGGFVCVAITFPDGHYEHLDNEVAQELVLTSTESLETSTSQ